jgi:hypothetical protein
MKIKQKAQLNKAISKILLLAILFGYGLHIDAFFVPKISYAAGIAQSPVVVPVIQLAAPLEAKNVSGVITYFSCSANNFAASIISLNPKLQDSTTANIGGVNNFTQPAFHLDPNLNQGCIQLSLGGAEVQKNLAVQDLNSNFNQQNLAVREGQNFVAFQFHSDNEGQGSPVVMQNFGTDSLGEQNVVASINIRAEKIVIKNIDNFNFSFNTFEVLRC